MGNIFEYSSIVLRAFKTDVYLQKNCKRYLFIDVAHCNRCERLIYHIRDTVLCFMKILDSVSLWSVNA